MLKVRLVTWDLTSVRRTWGRGGGGLLQKAHSGFLGEEWVRSDRRGSKETS